VDLGAVWIAKFKLKIEKWKAGFKIICILQFEILYQFSVLKKDATTLVRPGG
jgi:hypothetical protein